MKRGAVMENEDRRVILETVDVIKQYHQYDAVTRQNSK